MKRLYRLFEQAPVLGSLINPRLGGGDLLEAEFHELQPLLEKAVSMEAKDDQSHEMAVTAQGLAKAAEILAGQFTLVGTNVPFLGGHKQCTELAEYLSEEYEDAGGNLANALYMRLFQFIGERMSAAVVTPQDWMLSIRYQDLREIIVSSYTARALAFMGAHAFETIEGEVVTAGLSIWDKTSFQENESSDYLAIDGQSPRNPLEKAWALVSNGIIRRKQSEWITNPNSRITVESISASSYLSRYSRPWQGVKTSDDDRFVSCFWEHASQGSKWRFYLRALSQTDFTGREHLLLWEDGCGQLRQLNSSQPRDRKRDLQGINAWGNIGVVINTTGRIVSGLYLGDSFASEVVVLTAKDEVILPLLAFTNSLNFSEALRKLDKRVSVTTSTFSQVPFDLEHWQKVAAEKYPNGLPKPHSDDPTQWLFNGHPKGSEQPLHVAVARLLGYQWPRQTGSSFPDCPALGADGLEKHADDDGIVCLPPLNREQPASSRLRALLADALGSFDEKSLLASAGKKGSKAKSIEEWLRDEFFEQHCELFHHRPFLWHVWDGRKDGFHALVNYHKLDHATLQKLTYTYLGNWIHDQEADAKADKPGAAERLQAALQLQAELAKILEGEAPYDLFVRWKPLSKQAIGWHPDINDGVRLNIRPFLQASDVGKKGAGILRSKPNIKWDKDRGKEPERPKSDYPWFWCEDEPGTDPEGGKTFTGNRWNDVHLTLARKQKSQP
jgi:hypothetical protein